MKLISLRKTQLQNKISEAIQLGDQNHLLCLRSKLVHRYGIEALDYSEIEKPIRSNNFELFSYTDKYLENGGLEGSKRELPANISKEIKDEIYRILNLFMSIVDIRGIARVDFLLKDQELYINEVNTLPGFTNTSMYPMLWAASGIKIEKLVATLIEIAKE